MISWLLLVAGCANGVVCGASVISPGGWWSPRFVFVISLGCSTELSVLTMASHLAPQWAVPCLVTRHSPSNDESRATPVLVSVVSPSSSLSPFLSPSLYLRVWVFFSHTIDLDLDLDLLVGRSAVADSIAHHMAPPLPPLPPATALATALTTGAMVGDAAGALVASKAASRESR